jgi:transcriptional regulator with XRE-family HTH domain
MTLEQFRKARGLSLTALAELLGSKPSTVHGWLNGHRRPSWDWLDRIAEKTKGAVRPNDFSPHVEAAPASISDVTAATEAA